MNITFSKNQIVNCECPVLVLPIYTDEKFRGQTAQLDKKIGGFISEIIKEGYFTPELGLTHVIYTHEQIKSKKIVLCGMGKRKEITAEKMYRAISGAVVYVSKTKTQKCAVYLDDARDEWLGNIAQTAVLALYTYHQHKSKKTPHSIKEICFYVENKLFDGELARIAESAKLTAEAIYKARDMANEPSNIMTPEKLAKDAKNIVKGKNIDITIYDEKKIGEMGLGLFASVAKGSDEDAKLVVMDYKPEKYTKTIALVGKGLTFDAGGISIKPAEGMQEMKMDMAGAADVIATMWYIGKTQPDNIRIVGAFGATENLPGHKAQKPGDIWKAYNGKSVEVVNTDCEGRLVLADVMAYIGDLYKPDVMIDVATLTGSCLYALGYNYTGLFSNDKKLTKYLLDIADASYEKIWHMPIDEAFHEDIKSHIADLQNLGHDRFADASKAAAFLEEFVGSKTKWAHLDIAGPAMIAHQSRPYMPKGGSGAGVKTLIEYIARINKY